MPSLSDLSPISTSIFKTWHYLWFYKIVLDSPLFNFYIFHFRCNRVLTIKKIEKKFTQNFQHNHFWYVGLLFLVFFLGICSTCYCIVLTALQRYNQYTIKYTHVKYKSQRYFSKLYYRVIQPWCQKIHTCLLAVNRHSHPKAQRPLIYVIPL